MSSKWHAVSEVDRVRLRCRDEDLWIDLKRELSNGDRNRILFSGIRMTHGAAAVEDFERALFEKAYVWIAAWSLTDTAGETLPLTAETLRALRCDLFDTIDDAVTAHAKEVADASKKASTPQTATSATSGPGPISS